MTPALQRRAGSRGHPADDTTRIAAIDIGSNSIRQVVADVAPDGTIRIVDELKAMPRLGAGVATDGVLSAESMDRAIEALGRMAVLAAQLGAKRIEVIATSAVRDADNGPQFVARVQRETGLRVRVIDGTEEARLACRSAIAHFDLAGGRTVVMDIGGGSLELAITADGVVDGLASLPLGALRLTEAFLRDGEPRKAMKALRRHARGLIRDELPAREWRGARVIGSGGTFTNLAAVHLARQGITTAGGVHATRVGRADLEHILEMLVAMTPAERRAVPGLNPERADIILAGLGVAAEVLARVEARELEVSRHGIREGVLLEAARVPAAPASDRAGVRARAIEAFARRCHVEERHARQVQRLALRLFDALGERLGCEAGDRELLADAALLHDAGYHVSYERHHKHSYHLIAHADLPGIAPDEQVVIANVARYHRGAVPKRKHDNFGPLASGMRKRIRRLAALLRVADGLDRGHVGAVADVEAHVGNGDASDALALHALPARKGDPLRLELWGAHRKSGLLAELLDMPLAFLNPDGTPYAAEEALAAAP